MRVKVWDPVEVLLGVVAIATLGLIVLRWRKVRNFERGLGVVDQYDEVQNAV